MSARSNPSVHWTSLAAGVAIGALAATAVKAAARMCKQRRTQHAAASPPRAAAAAASDTSSSPSASCPSSSAGASLLDFLLLVGRCKTEKRTGWVNCGVPLPESVADHQWRMAVMAMTCVDYTTQQNKECTCGSATNAKENDASVVSPGRAVRMALVHDLAESLVGDITPTEFSGVSKADKHRMESEAMQRIIDTLTKAHATTEGQQSTDGNTDIGAELMSLWQEYEAGATATAKFVKHVDKMEMYVQAYEYQQAALSADTAESRRLYQQLQRFFDGMPDTRAKAAGSHSPPQRLLCAAMDELQRRRTEGHTQTAGTQK